ncbi:fibronectin type III domain-containing protein [Bacillus cereus group sp. MYBK40-2]|uniref:fibronectin type III domain-containing protein n=1 Tax=unclassified Bacillus cereus group TaxID=2750818 RepID=UPI003F78E71D
MKFKKCGFLLAFVMVFCFAIPSISNAESNDLVKGKLDGELISGATSKRIEFDSSYSIESLYVWFKIQTASDASVYIKLYNQDESLVWTSNVLKVRYLGSSYKGDEYNLPVNMDHIKYMEVSSNKAVKIVNFKAFGNEYMPEVSDFNGVASSDSQVKLSWVNPIASEDAASTKLYKDGKAIKTFNISENVTSYVVNDLQAGKTYDFKMTTINKSSKESSGITRSVKVSMPVIAPPENVFLTPQDKKIVIAWDDVKSPFLKGYNVYIDGKKINDEPLTSNKLIVKNLENDKSYKVQVSAVNKEDVEGEKSKEVSEKPSSSALEVDYDVKIPFSPLDLIKSSFSLLAILGGFVLLSIVIIWFRPLKGLIVKAVRREKDKK